MAVASKTTNGSKKRGAKDAATKWVYLFDEVATAEEAVGGSWDGVRALLGGKGANLAEMTRIGVPVPPGFSRKDAHMLMTRHTL